MNAPWLWWIVGYLAGSIPFGLLIGLSRGIDIRKAGSGNIGATNAGRVLGRRWGIVCFALDVLKGWAPVFAAGWAMGLLGQRAIEPAAALAWLAVAAAAMLGHIFPLWLGFRGGKGVATGFGVMLGVWPLLTLPVLAALLIWGLCLALTRYVSLASMVAGIAIPVLIVVIARIDGVPLARRWPFLAVAAFMALLVILRHRANIHRLLAGAEPRVFTGKEERREAGGERRD